MNTIKIPRDLFEQAKSDLLRRHPFAFERVGFFSTRCSRSERGMQVYCVAYNSIPDHHYVRDDSVGARIGSQAITEAMTRSVNESVGQIHVHWHGGIEMPTPSLTDRAELPSLAGSLRNATRSQAHGWLILGEKDAFASMLLPGNVDATVPPSVAIVGFPTVHNRRANSEAFLRKVAAVSVQKNKNAKKGERYDRQSFLGEDAMDIIARTVVGIVGLGGGGSHVVQQLAHLGFQNFVLCDHDIITESNLNRLVGASCADVRAKKLKSAIAEKNILKLHKTANVTSPGNRWEEMLADLSRCDLIFGCVDTYSARRDLEAFCRRQLTPYIDVGMDVRESANGGFEIDGQVILSMPGKPCMHCFGFLNETVLGQEAAKYGAAGSRPQVVWSNGMLCSAAVGVAVDLLTDWSKSLHSPVYLSFKGSELSLSPDNRLKVIRNAVCRHYPLSNAGDPVIKVI